MDCAFQVGEMRTRVNLAREKLMSEVQGDAGAADCLIWRNASKEYKREARELARHLGRGEARVAIE